MSGKMYLHFIVLILFQVRVTSVHSSSPTSTSRSFSLPLSLRLWVNLTQRSKFLMCSLPNLAAVVSLWCWYRKYTWFSRYQKWLCLLLGLDLPEQAMGWLPLRFGIGSEKHKPTEFSCTCWTVLVTPICRRLNFCLVWSSWVSMLSTLPSPYTTWSSCISPLTSSQRFVS